MLFFKKGCKGKKKIQITAILSPDFAAQMQNLDFNPQNGYIFFKSTFVLH